MSSSCVEDVDYVEVMGMGIIIGHIGQYLRKPRYRRPEMSGWCVCGHRWDRHHLGMIVRYEYVNTTSGPEHYIPQECEAFGHNEMGGLDRDGHVHCFGYVDRNE